MDIWKRRGEKMSISNVTGSTMNYKDTTRATTVQGEYEIKKVMSDIQPAQVAMEAKEKGDSNSEEVDVEKIKKAVDELNKNMPHSEVIYGIHDKTNRVTIKVVDKSTKELIKEFPPEKTLDLIAKAWEMAGIMIDEKR